MREKYELIDRTLESNKNVLTVSYLCQSAGVSRSGYYSWKKRKNVVLRQEKGLIK